MRLQDYLASCNAIAIQLLHNGDEGSIDHREQNALSVQFDFDIWYNRDAELPTVCHSVRAVVCRAELHGYDKDHTLNRYVVGLQAFVSISAPYDVAPPPQLTWLPFQAAEAAWFWGCKATDGTDVLPYDLKCNKGPLDGLDADMHTWLDLPSAYINTEPDASRNRILIGRSQLLTYRFGRSNLVRSIVPVMRPLTMRHTSALVSITKAM